MEKSHIPVLLKKVIEGLKIEKGKKYIDATVGQGGHTEEILRRGGQVLGIDYDPEAIGYTRRRWKVESRRWKIDEINLVLVRGNFKDLKKIALSNNFNRVSGIIFDLGVSTEQLLTPERGFSFRFEAPLDMRMDPTLSVTAADLINGLNKGELYELFSRLGEEKRARAIARAVIFTRALKPITTTAQLVRVVEMVYGKKRGRIHPATKVFQALRIAVNDELNNLRVSLPQTVELLEKGGRSVVISFHSLEDRIVKQFFKSESEKGRLEILTKKPIRPTFEEIRANPRCRSAKARIAEKL